MQASNNPNDASSCTYLLSTIQCGSVGGGGGGGGNMVKKRKRPVAVVPPPLRSQKLARRITSRFHELTAEQALGRDVSVELSNLGGREAYQRASQLSTSLCRHTTKFVLGRLVKMGLGPRKKRTPVKVCE